MAGAFPTLSDGQTTRAGLKHSVEIRAEVQQFRFGTEQRYAVSGLLNSWELAYQDLSWADLVRLLDFFLLQKGAFDALWSLSLRDPAANAVRAYQHLAFDTDEFSVTEGKRTRYSVTLPVVQTVAETVAVSPQAAFPQLATGARVQLPATAALRFQTFRNDLEAGKRIAYYAWPEPLRRWPLEFGLITDAELQTYANFYVGQGGPIHSFTFADPDTGVVYNGCRFAPKALEITRVSRNANRLSLTVEQYRI